MIRTIHAWIVFKVVLLASLTYLSLLTMMIWTEYIQYCIHNLNPLENEWYTDGYKLNQKERCDKLFSITIFATIFTVASGFTLLYYLLINYKKNQIIKNLK